jgi:hypothetical protein
MHPVGPDEQVRPDFAAVLEQHCDALGGGPPVNPPASRTTSSARPIDSGARNALTHKVTPAPTSLSSGACSQITGSRPRRAKAMPAVSALIPPPMITIAGRMLLPLTFRRRHERHKRWAGIGVAAGAG